MSDVIAALATANVRSAIGIIRMSGFGCAAIADSVFTPDHAAALDACPDRKLCLGTLHDRQHRVIDHCMAVYSRAPHTYTGEDTVELQCHGSPVMLSAALEALLAAGARMAQPGEFTKRAFLNGRMDLTQAEAVIDLIDADTADAAANAAGQVGGALRVRIERISDALTKLLAHFHAVLDYPDEDIDPFEMEAYRQTLHESISELNTLLGSCERGQILKDGVNAVLLGRPNVGKSSLLNLLAGFDRVIVSATAGTTRDTVEQSVLVGGIKLRLTDTAGIHAASDELEALGVERSLRAAANADLALFVCDGSQPLCEADEQALQAAKRAKFAIGLLNKSDLPAVVASLPLDCVLSVSAKTGDGLDALRALIQERFGSYAAPDGTILVSSRQAGACAQAVQALKRAEAAMDAGFTPDAVLTDVEAALDALGEITGRIMRDEVLASIFANFCVGK